MSENKTTKTEAQLKYEENLLKAKKAIESSKETTSIANDNYLDALQGLKNSHGGEQKLVDSAKKKVEETKAEYAKKYELEIQVRIKFAQSGSYVPADNERKLFHVKLDKPTFDTKTGKKLSKEFIQKFTVAEWGQFEKNSSGLGFSQEIMWNPEVYSI